MPIEVGLDLAGTTGYAIRDLDTDEIYTGIWTLTRGDIGGRRSPIPAVRLLRRLERLSSDYEIRRVAYEETFGRGNAKFRLDSLQVTTMVWAVRSRINWQRYSPSAIKMRATGKGNAGKELVWQAACDKWPKLYIPNDNVADALWVLDCLELVK